MNIPTDTKETIDNYVSKGWVPGDFIVAVLSNDLLGACERADHQNRYILFDIVSYCYKTVPRAAWGSLEKVNAWLLKFREKKDVGE